MATARTGYMSKKEREKQGKWVERILYLKG